MSWPVLLEGCSCRVEGDDHYNTIIRDINCPIHNSKWRANKLKEAADYRALVAERGKLRLRLDKWFIRANYEDLKKLEVLLEQLSAS